MYDETPYAYSMSGNLIVLADGPELLVYSAANDQGLWKLMCEDVLVGVGVTEAQVLAVDAAGRVSAYRPIDGQKLFDLDTDAAPITMRVSEEGHALILEDQALCVVRPGVDPVRVGWSGPRHAAWEPGSATFGVGGEDGTFAIVDPASAAPLGTVNLGSAITGVAWRADGTWAVAHGQQVSFIKLGAFVEELGRSAEVAGTLPVNLPVGEVTVSVDGSILAVMAGPQAVNLFELAGNAPVGTVSFQRDIAHIQFGPKHWLGFGFDDGDANRIDVASGKITRTQAHQGRGQNAWAMNASVNQALVRGGIANVAAKGAAIAEKGKPKFTKPKKRGKKVNTWLIIAAAGGAFMVVFILLCGGGGLLATFLGFSGWGL